MSEDLHFLELIEWELRPRPSSIVLLSEAEAGSGLLRDLQRFLASAISAAEVRCLKPSALVALQELSSITWLISFGCGLPDSAMSKSKFYLETLPCSEISAQPSLKKRVFHDLIALFNSSSAT